MVNHSNTALPAARATAAEPEVSALRDGIPSADPHAERIARYLQVCEMVHGEPLRAKVEYRRGWYVVRSYRGYTLRYRAKQIDQMIGDLLYLISERPKDEAND